MSKIVCLRAQNFKCLKAIEVRPEKPFVAITGKNAAGKSAVLDGIVAALGGKSASPKEPIRIGESFAEVLIETEDYTITRNWSADGKSNLVVQNTAGSDVKSPQRMLEKLLGSNTFDPLRFSGLTDREQRETLLQTIGLDLSAHDTNIECLRNTRNAALAEKKRLASNLEASPYNPNLPTEEIDIVDLTNQLRDAHATNQKITTIEQYCENVAGEIQSKREQIRRLEAEIEGATSQLEQLRQEAQQLLPVDTAELEDQIAKAQETNEVIRANIAAAVTHEDITSYEKKASQLYVEIAEAEREKAKAIGAAQMPVAGLSVDENGVTFKGIPFRQINQAKRLEVSMAIAMAANPELRIMLIDANGLDSDSLQLIADMAERNKYQVWAEIATDGEDFGIVIEDGAIKE